MNTRKLLIVGSVLIVVVILGIGMTLTMVSEGTYSNHGGVKWYSDLDMATIQASDEGSAVLAYVWLEDCGSCEMFEDELERKGPPAEMDAFVLAEIQAGDDTELMARYNISAAPTLVVLTENSTMVTSFNPLEVEDLGTRLEKEHKNATNQSEQ